jgi:fatty acid desaturase
MSRYTLTHIHFFIYLATFCLSSYTFFTYEACKLLSSIMIGWSAFALGTLGHDAHHNSLSNNIKLNKAIAYMFMDMMLFSSKDWIYLHNDVHHKYLMDERDIMFLSGESFVSEFLHVLQSHIMLARKDKNIMKRHLPKLPFYYFLFSLRLYSVTVFITYMLCLSYLTYITHSYRRQSSYKPTSREFHLDNTWDIYPKSHFVSMLTGGINAHATHHIYPHATRSEQFQLCDKIQAKFPGYRRIDTFVGLVNLFWNRGSWHMVDGK